MIAVVIAGQMPSAPTASADPSGCAATGATVCFQDNRTMVWCFGESMQDGRALLKSSIRWATDYLERNTVMQTVEVDGCSAVDVRFMDVNLATNTYGVTTCNQANEAPNQVCRQWYVKQDTQNQQDVLTNPGNDPHSDGVNEPGELEINFKKTSLHEIGHTLGLWHHPAGNSRADRTAYYNSSQPDRVPDAMVRLHIENSADWLRLNAHHRFDHINQRY